MNGIVGQAVEYPESRTIIELIETVAERAPSAPAVAYGALSLTYRQLNTSAEHLAARLHAMGVGAGDFIPLVMRNGPELPVAMLAAMKLAAPFVPVDDTAPAHVQARMINDLDPRLIVCSAAAGAGVAGAGVAGAAAAGAVASPLPRVVVDLRAAHEDDRDPAGPLPAGRPGLDDIAYGFYTTGSTGAPKCALNIHRGLLNRFLYMSRRFGGRTDEIVLQNSRHVFDSSLWQLLWPLTNGSRVVIPDRTGILDLQATVEVIACYRVTMTDFVPSIFNTLVAMMADRPEISDQIASLRRILIGGEEANADAVQAFRAMLPQVAIINTYGPTEASIGSIFHEVSDEDTGSIPIGRPIDNTYAVIVDGQMKPVAPGIAGEILLGGDCLGLGYLNDPGRTRAAFIDNPFPGIPGSRLYRTGDLGRYLPSGLIHFAGRTDQQVKIAGLRIELSEVELALLRHPRVREAKVIVRDGAGSRWLVAFATGEGRLDPADLRAFARGELSPQLVPKEFVILDRMPLNANGKADRRELARLAALRRPVPALVGQPGEAGPLRKAGPLSRVGPLSQADPLSEAGPLSEADPLSKAGPLSEVGPLSQADPLSEAGPLSEVEQVVWRAWQELLPVPPSSNADDFFDLGGDSLTAQMLALRLARDLGWAVSVRDIADCATIAQQASLVNGLHAGNGPASPVPARIEADTRLPADIAPADVALNGLDRVFLTGATGFVGAHLLHDLLTATTADVFCLVRASTADAALDRVTDNLAQYRLWEDDFAGRIHALPGDLSQPRLGLDAGTYRRLGQQIDTLVHNGALVNLVRGYITHRAANVIGTVEILRFATAFRLKQLHYISTLSTVAPVAGAAVTGAAVTGAAVTGAAVTEASVAGAPVAGGAVLRALEAPVPPHLPRGGYGQSKWVAERLLGQAAERGMTVAVYRLGDMMPHSLTGVPSRRGLPDLLAKACLRLRMCFTSPILMNYTPVDCASRLIATAVARGEAGYFHIRHPERVPFDDLLAVLRSEFGLEQVSYRQFWNAMCAVTDAGADPELRSTLALVPRADAGTETEVTTGLAALFEADAAASPALRTDRLMADTGMRWPPISRKIFERYATYYRNGAASCDPAG